MGTADKRLSPVLLTAGAVVLGSVFFVCGGVGTFGMLWLHDRNTVQVKVDSSAADLRFGKWTRRKTVWLGTEVELLESEVTAGAKEAKDFDYIAEEYDGAGSKLYSTMLSFPELRPHEKGQVRFQIHPKTTRVVISKRHD